MPSWFTGRNSFSLHYNWWPFVSSTWKCSEAFLTIVETSAHSTVMWLVVAQKQTTSWEILLWMTPSEAPKALQASECSELLDPTRANCWISAQHQPGKFIKPLQMSCIALLSRLTLHRPSMGHATSAYIELISNVYTCMCIPRPKAACCNTCQHTYPDQKLHAATHASTLSWSCMPLL